MKITLVNIEDIIIEKDNVRTKIDQKSIEELARSILEVGLINPITLKQKQNKLYLIAGQRRLLAYKHLQRSMIEALTYNADDEIAFAMQVQENIQREKVNVLDEGRAFARAISKLAITQKQLAKLIAKTESYVSDRLQTQKYFPALRRALENKRISFSVAREFAKIESKKDLERYLEFAENSGVNPRTARNWVRAYKLNNKVVDHVALPEPLTDENKFGSGSKLMTGCHVCRKAVDLTEVRHLNLCSECFELIMKS